MGAEFNPRHIGLPYGVGYICEEEGNGPSMVHRMLAICGGYYSIRGSKYQG